jgi:hypothetical protein
MAKKKATYLQYGKVLVQSKRQDGSVFVLRARIESG